MTVILRAMADDDLDWLGDLRWRGYPHLSPVRDIASENSAPTATAAPEQPDPRLGEMAREIEALRARIGGMGRSAEEFERRLREAGQSYEGALLEAESRLRDATLDRERLNGELNASRAELARLNSRDVAREADLRLERERRGDGEKALVLARRQIEELTERAERLQTSSSQDITLFRQELREFLAQLRRGKGPAGEAA